MKKSILIGIILYLLLPSLVQAHTLETNGSVGAVMHIDPDDDPIIGQPTRLYLEFKDKQQKLTLPACNCQMAITKNGEPVYATKLTAYSDTEASVSYTFPEKNIYTIKISGTPQITGAFDPFSLEYTIRVARESTESTTPSTQKALPIYPIGLGLLVGIIVLGWLKLRRKKH